MMQAVIGGDQEKGHKVTKAKKRLVGNAGGGWWDDGAFRLMGIGKLFS